MPSLVDKLKEGGRMKTAEESPLFKLDRLVKEVVQKELEKASKQIVAELSGQIDVESVVSKLLSKEAVQSLSPKKGRDYFDGKPGRDGRDGRSIKGEKGDKGDKGKDGSPDTPDQVVSKVNKASKKINLSAIERIEEELEKIRDAVRKSGGKSGGGGMGKPIHETFSGDGSTTSFTLSNNVAASGTAAWVYYNGQFLVNSTHWSVSGTTLSLTFTPEDGTSIDITYIRT